ncbi:TonB-dependent receptor [Janthinobacterium sp. 17J80-10]|uniref:TonB-dependent receptor n=1 Tax=Janthinobacterium sp. 17J80-10 TaxID=2497863 RepID=UPI0010052C3A|nr:TonB-dependent receptor [Janthinobacterium sp. 17J80-10]QAU35977.1 TonB-dependent receptor [Janthinobacterium sp. 17J80-10]
MGARAEPVESAPPSSLKPVIVTSTRTGLPPFATPASVDVVDGESMRSNLPQVNLSESLAGVPGMLIQNRQNYAQDLQIAIRGFGSRSTFGIRGVRLYVDGIPATLPDGQGQSSNIDIASAERVEILRGPYSALYGNSSGGVIQVFTEEGSGALRLTPSLTVGSHGLRRYGTKAAGSGGEEHGALDYLVSASRFTSDGYREHSDAARNLANARLGIRLDTDSKLTLVANSVALKAQDPLGLDWAQFRADPRSVAAVAIQFDTRKTVQQAQGGLVYERRIDGANDMRIMAYYGQRDTVQFQAIPPGPQANPRHAGGVISLGRDYGGIDARWTTRLHLAGRPLTLVGGLAWDTLEEQRQGYENFIGATLGVQGALRRNESNTVWNLDPYLQGAWEFAERWTLDAGVRQSTVRFSSDDLYIVGLNGDDSGAARYRKLLPMAALRYQARHDLNLYATVGRGFETPTFNELSYRTDGLSGLNFGLRPSVNTSAELGAKARLGGGMLTAAVFRIRTEDEIVSAGSLGGRATFQNAGRTRRNGMELGWDGKFAHNWRVQASHTWLEATYRDSFCSPACSGVNPAIPAGNSIPGIARQMAYVSLAWAPPQGWRTGIEGRYLDRIYVNDRNSEAAPGYFTAAVHTGYLLQINRWTIDGYARIDNLFDRRYAGSVIINEGNGRYFEPAPGRNWSAGMSAAYRF